MLLPENLLGSRDSIQTPESLALCCDLMTTEVIATGGGLVMPFSSVMIFNLMGEND